MNESGPTNECAMIAEQLFELRDGGLDAATEGVGAGTRRRMCFVSGRISL